MSDAAPLTALPFVKMHGLGNDFVVLDARNGAPVPCANLARALADRHTGVGCDQVVALAPGEGDALHLHFFNADGSLSGACGNATRCIAAREMARRGTDRLVLTTARGRLAARREEDGTVRVNLGPPQRDWQSIPLARPADPLALPLPGAPVAVGMGNPHCVHFVADVADVDLSRVGPAVEVDPLFPDRTNVEFATVRPDGSIRLRVWERGAGITRACGSGACATAVAAALTGRTGRQVALELDGGWLHVDWAADGVWLAGPVAHVFDGVLAPGFAELA